MLSKLRYLLWEIANKYIVHGFNHGGEPLGCADCLNPHFLNAGAFLCSGYVPADMGRIDRKPLDSAVCRQLCAYAFIDYPASLVHFTAVCSNHVASVRRLAECRADEDVDLGSADSYTDNVAPSDPALPPNPLQQDLAIHSSETLVSVVTGVPEAAEEAIHRNLQDQQSHKRLYQHLQQHQVILPQTATTHAAFLLLAHLTT